MSVKRILRRLNYLHGFFDCGLVVFSLYASLAARVGFDGLIELGGILTSLLPFFLVLRIGTFLVARVYDIKWRYVSTKDSVTIVKSIVFSSLLIIATTYLLDLGHLPRSMFFIDAVFLLVLMAGSRVLRRIWFEHCASREMEGSGKSTLVYGAGVSGRALAHRITTDASMGLRLVGFIDDNPVEQGRTIYGRKILGSWAELPYILDQWRVQELILGFSNVSGEFLQRLIPVCKRYGVRLRRLGDFASGNGERDGMLRSIELGDLLGRKQKSVDLSKASSLLRGQTVVITGAGGSIGSELSRQVLGFAPKTLILVDHSEYNLYTIEHELRSLCPSSSELIPALVDVKDRNSLARIFAQYEPHVVLHAAAYKHVQLVEQNAPEAILNNIEGTRNLLDLAEKHDVGTFILISTDKAVNPVGVMGATKRACELLVQGVGSRTKRRYCSVRFGNVLGSSGSLIPLLQKQIIMGQPLTITHPDMTRYFMLIPEAVSLVLRAATIASPGDVAILDMGEPVKIVDIAKSLRALMGKSEDESPIVFTGIRPGEKMYEELYLCGDEVMTQDPNIFLLPAGDGAADDRRLDISVYDAVQKILDLAKIGDSASARALFKLVKRYSREAIAESTEITTATPARKAVSS
jgi:FlaA1/EpsC-like NDP-sugar epimerase